VLRRRFEWAIAAGLLALAAALCLYRLGARSIWLDEAAALRIAQVPHFKALLSDGGNMAAYYLFLKGWLVFGHTGWIARLPSVIFSVVAAGLFFLLARRLFGLRVAATATLLLAINSSYVRYAQESRSYALELMLVVAAWLVLALGLESRKLRWFLLWGLLDALAVATHLFAVFFLPAQLASLLLLPKGSVPMKRILSGLGVLLAGAAPILFIAVRNGGAHIGWIPPLSIATFRQAILFLGGANFEPTSHKALYLISLVVLVAGAAGLAMGGWGAVRSLRIHGRSLRAWCWGMPVFWLIVPLAGATAVSVVRPLMVPRYFLALLPAGSLLMAIALCRLRRPAYVCAASVLLAALGLSGVARSYGAGEWGWRQATKHLAAEASPGDDVVVLPSYQRLPFDYSLRSGRGSPDLNYISPSQAPWRIPDPTVFGFVEAFYRPSSPAEAANRAAGRSRFWLITTDFTRWDASGRVVEARADSGAFFRRLGPGFKVASGHGYGRVAVLLIKAKPALPGSGH